MAGQTKTAPGAKRWLAAFTATVAITLSLANVKMVGKDLFATHQVASKSKNNKLKYCLFKIL